MHCLVYLVAFIKISKENDEYGKIVCSCKKRKKKKLRNWIANFIYISLEKVLSSIYMDLNTYFSINTVTNQCTEEETNHFLHFLLILISFLNASSQLSMK